MSYWHIVTGTLSGERQAQVAADGQTFAGVLPSVVTGEGALWPLQVQGGTADGQTLTFLPVIGEPSGPPPTARLRVSFEGPQAIVGLTPISFDASGSSGEQLSYFLEFGDGEYTSERSAQHAMDVPTPLGWGGSFMARVTVTDRFGRFDVASQRFGDVVSLAQSTGYSEWINLFTNPRTGRVEQRILNFDFHDGRSVAGVYRHPEGWASRFSGTVDGQWGIELTLDGGGIAFKGRIRGLSHMPLAAAGGSADGITLEFLHKPYT